MTEDPKIVKLLDKQGSGYVFLLKDYDQTTLQSGEIQFQRKIHHFRRPDTITIDFVGCVTMFWSEPDYTEYMQINRLEITGEETRYFP